MTDPVRNRLRAAYDAAAETRDRREPAAWKQDVRSSFLRHLRAEGHKRLLEIGAGPGRDAAFFARAELDVVCVDLSPEMVRLCLEKGLEAYVGDATDLRFPDGAFDAVYSLNVFLHLARTELPAALREVRRVLRPKGLFFLGLYGGIDRAGTWDEDTCEPKRFFSFHTDEKIVTTVEEQFDVVAFDRIPVDTDGPRLHFQSILLRNRDD